MIFKEFSGDDIRTKKNYLNQLVDISNTDISSSSTRKKHLVFVTGSVGPGVTSSLFQTVFDQDFTLQTANPVFDMTLGLSVDSEVVSGTNPTVDQNGKYLFPQTSLMMREKIDMYRTFAQELLGDSEATFTARSGSNTSEIKEALFIGFKRLFARDQIKRETFAIRLNPSASNVSETSNLDIVGSSTTKIFTDINSTVNKEYLYGGQVSTLVDSSNTSVPVGLLFLDKGIVVLDMSKSFDMSVELTGAIDAVTTSGIAQFSGSLRYLLASASMDDILDHIASTRFSGSNESSIVFQNITNINSTVFYCRIGADEFNYSSNPTFTDSDNRIVVIDEGQEETQRSFVFITGVGLYDARDNLLAVAKASRPILNENDRALTLSVRIDY